MLALRLQRLCRIGWSRGFRKCSAQACSPLLETDVSIRQGHDQEDVSSQLNRFHPDVRRMLSTVIESGEEDAFRVVCLDEVRSRMMIWKQLLPRVAPFYAVKCNPDQQMLQLLASCGAGFDCASRHEIEHVLDMGVTPSRIIYANPIKQPSHLRAAKAHDVKLMTFDSAEELTKIARGFPEARLLLRLLPDDSSAQCQLGMKYGTPLSEVRRLLREANMLGLAVDGVSFHVGSGNANPSAWDDALKMAREALDMAKDEGFSPSVLNIGGGFPADRGSFESVAASVRESLSKLFPEGPDQLSVMAEPGRYMVATAETLAVNVIGMSRTAGADAVLGADNEPSQSDPHRKYFINDGIYGSFNCLMYDHAKLEPPVALSASHKRFAADCEDLNHLPSALSSATSQELPASPCTQMSSVWGQTCDGLDRVLESVELPEELGVGDWLVFPSMGAYTSAAGSEFNGFSLPRTVYC